MFNPLEYIDKILNRTTMYRLVLWSLVFLLGVAFALSLFHLLPFTALDLFFSTAFIVGACFAFNYAFAKIFNVPSNVDSVWITAFILALIITPSVSWPNGISFILLASLGAIASKYILAVNRKHLFNPAAFGVALTALFFGKYASWWIGTLYMAPFVFAIGFLIARKLQRWDLVLSFFAVSIILSLGWLGIKGQDVFALGQELILRSPLMFFAFVMLTEPMTTPPTRRLRLWYGAFVGLLFAPFTHVGSFSFTPEIALVTGNIFSYLVSPKIKLVLQLKEKEKIAENTYDFVFEPQKKMNFIPGQYMEWTLGHPHQDNRGQRRYFTIASSPTEPTVRIGVKFYDRPSSYKKTLDQLVPGKEIVASQLAGDFVLPKDPHKKLVLLAGGIGITPFRSMIKYLIDTNEKRDIVLFYAATSPADIAYKEIFDEAQSKLGITVVYVTGFVTEEMIRTYVPDFTERMFYISGPRTMVTAFKKSLKETGVQRTHIKTDFFPGFA